MSRGNLIIIGASARAAAQSAIRAGYSPWCIDLFADRDLQAIAPVKRCAREAWPMGIVDLMKDAPPGPVLLTGAMENHLEVVKAVERDRKLMAGPATAIEMLRLPRAAHRALTESLEKKGGLTLWRSGITCVPAIHWDDDLRIQMPDRWRRYLADETARGGAFLVKPRLGAGGRGIRRWSKDETVGEDEIVQRMVAGRSLSAVFHASGAGTALLGITEQLVGDAALGAPSPFGYVGNLFPAQVGDDVRLQFQLAGDALAKWSGLHGIFGIDAMLPDAIEDDRPLNRGRLHIVDINPRYPASAELIERALPGVQVLLSRDGVDGAVDARPVNDRCFGKAIVFAKQGCCWRSHLFENDLADVADVPGDGEVIEAGQPICTIFAQGPTREMCLAGLRERASNIYTRLAST